VIGGAVFFGDVIVSEVTALGFSRHSGEPLSCPAPLDRRPQAGPDSHLSFFLINKNTGLPGPRQLETLSFSQAARRLDDFGGGKRWRIKRFVWRCERVNRVGIEGGRSAADSKLLVAPRRGLVRWQ
jgi:hypothetical protein